jgi:hypothetical protein
MQFTPLAFMELFVVLAFGVGWLILERVARRLDRQRLDHREAADEEAPPKDEVH